MSTKHTAICPKHGRTLGHMLCRGFTRNEESDLRVKIAKLKNPRTNGPLVHLNGPYSSAFVCMHDDAKRPHGVCGRVMSAPRRGAPDA